MANDHKTPTTLEEVMQFANIASPAERRPWIGKSATERICTMAGVAPASVPADAPSVRAMLSKIRPAAHGITAKTWANLLSRFRMELRLAGVLDPNHAGSAARHPAWATLVQAISGDKALSNGLASFCNWCAAQNIYPDDVDDALVQRFLHWLEHRTLCPKPRDIVRQTPRLWNAASEQVATWPKAKLKLLSFKAPAKRLQWGDLPESFRADAEAYLAMRANADPFDERPNAPSRPLAASTLRQQKVHLRLAASVLVESGVPIEEITSLSALVERERFKTVLRHYLDRAKGQPNAFVVGLAKTLIQAADHYVGASQEQITQLKRIARKLPSIPFELTAKNKAFLRQFESDRLRAELLFLPERLVADVAKALAEGKFDFVRAQVAVAIDFQLAIPLRPQNLSRLNWQRHFVEPDGPRGRLLLHIPKIEMKGGREDFNAEVPDDVARRLRWYRRHILTRLNADVNGDLFVTRKGIRKDQKTITVQITRVIADLLGIHMTVHQFRHLAGASYLDENPEDTESARALLGHAYTKTTRIYVGSASRRASRAYNRFLFQQRDALILKRKRQRMPKTKKG
ncbi:MAG: site-specific integrase [Methyloceanibacter sp.]|nr:site-specific integrase [Methyloceanibacter sp.]